MITEKASGKVPEERNAEKLMYLLGAILIAVKILFISATLRAGEKEEALKPGDKLPRKVWLLKYKGINEKGERKTISLQDYAGKPFILDFWATWCGGCISAMDKIDSLQALFKNQFSVLPVSTQSEALVRPFLARLAKQRNLRLTSLVEDSTFTSLFPYYTLPHYVWIDSNGIVVRISGVEDLTVINLHNFLEGGLNPENRKEEQRLPYDRLMPLFVAGNGGELQAINYRSLITAYTPSLPLQTSVKTDSLKGRKISALNQPLGSLYQIAYRDHGYISRNRVKFEVKDESRLNSSLTGADYLNWLQEGNGFCYELIVPPHLISRSFEIMQQDLDRFFPHYYARIERRPAMCLILERTGTEDKLKSRGGKPGISFDNLGGRVSNMPLSDFVFRLTALYLQNQPCPVLDETGYKRPVDLSINTDMTNPEALNEAFKPYGLRLVKEERNVEMLVISDRGLIPDPYRSGGTGTPGEKGGW